MYSNDIKYHRLNATIVSESSPILLRMFMNSLFIYVDVEIREKDLYSDRVYDPSPVYTKQVRTL